MSVMWSGPGKALSFHIDLAEDVNKIDKVVSEQIRQGRINPKTLPVEFLQRLNLMTSFGEDRISDGGTVSTGRDAWHTAFTETNINRTLGEFQAERLAIQNGETHYVSQQVMHTVEEAAQSIPDDATHETDWPSPAGLIVFEEPYVHDDLHPKTGEVVEGLHMPIRAIAWHTSAHVGVHTPEGMVPRPGVTLILYTDAEAWLRIYCDAHERLVGPVNPENGDLASDVMSAWPVDVHGWAFGTAWTDGGFYDFQAEENNEPGVIHGTVSRFRRWLLAYSRWCQSRIIVTGHHREPRPARRRAMRANMPEDGYVKVLKLRRVDRPNDPDAPVGEGLGPDYAVVVRGHWRRVFVPSLAPDEPARLADGSINPANHRVTWIDPHIRGDGPLVLGHDVSASVR